MPRPNFFVIGAPRCGTTALHRFLGLHPQVFVTTPKEPHFFAPDLPGYRDVTSRDAYEQLFANAQPGHWRFGEASVFYLYSREAAQRIRRYAPTARIIALVRNPLDLLPSFHSQLLYSRDEDEPSFEQAWRLLHKRRQGARIPRYCRAPQLLRYDRFARFGEQLERWFDLFGREQIHVVFFEELVERTASELQRLLQFLKLSDAVPRELEHLNARRGHRWNWLADFTQRTPQPLVDAALTFKRLTGIRRLGVLDTLRRWNETQALREPLAPWLRDTIADIYAEDVARLGRLTGRDLSHWLDPERQAPRRFVGEDSQELVVTT